MKHYDDLIQRLRKGTGLPVLQALMNEAADAIAALTAADVRPVVRGKWERMPDNEVFGDVHCKCSACGEDWWQGPGWFRNAHFCPNCGADMREES